MGAIANAGAVVASIARGVVIALVALLCVVVYAGGAVRRLALRDRAARERHRARQRGRLLRWAFEWLGATFVKIGQVISSRPDVVSPYVVEELRVLQDHVRSFSRHRVRKVIERELKAPLARTFREFDRDPVAAGSVAQVHRAVLHNGLEVAIKVLRPGVRACVRRDAQILLALARVAEWISSRARAADMRAHVRSLVAGILAQTDLRHEATNYDRFRQNFAGVPGLAFPRVHHEYSTRDVLTMEFVRGDTLDHAASEHLPQVTRVMRASFFAMCFEHGLVHADLHPGNVLVRRDGVLVMLDVGLVKQLSESVVETIVDFARCLLMGAASDLVNHLQTHHAHGAAVDWPVVELDVALFVAAIRGHSMAELETSVLVGQLFTLARKHRIRPMPELSLVLLGMVTIEGIAKRLDPGANTLHEIAAFLGPRLAGPHLARGSREWPANAMLGTARVPAAAPVTRVDHAEPSLPPTTTYHHGRCQR